MTCTGCDVDEECDDPNDPYEYGSGGGGSGGPGTFPSNPVNGQLVTFYYPDGTYREYIYDAATATWGIVYTELPAIVVTTNASTYPFLQMPSPYNGLTVLGPENMLYTYQSGSGYWIGVYSITNNVTNPCIRQQVERALAESLVNAISNLVQNTFNINDKINLDLSQVGYLDADESASTSAYKQGEILNVEIFFNENTLPSRSKEFIMATVYHELLHAILYSNYVSPIQQHTQMASQYVNILALALMEHFPNLSMSEANHLSWGGLQGTAAWNSLTESERNAIIATNIAHKQNQSGHSCN
jgi:hypothetical protein